MQIKNFEAILNEEDLLSLNLSKDELYPLFIIKDNLIISTPYFKYILANQAKEYFKEIIKLKDLDYNFMKMRIVADVDPEDIKKEMLKYSDLIEKANIEKAKWRNDHIAFYRQQPSLPSSSVYSDIFNNIDIQKEVSLESAIQGYKAANETLKSIDNSELDPYCTETRLMLNYEHREEYSKAMDEIDRKYNIPSEKEIAKNLPVKNLQKFRLSLDRSKCINNDPAILFTSQFLNNLHP